MLNFLHSNKALLSICVTTALLTACGGGGSDSTSASYRSVDTTGTTNTGTSSSVKTSSAELGAFNTLNTNRIQCGFGALQNNAQLKNAAVNHANYLIYASEQGSNTLGHYETTRSNPYYSGYQISDRVKTAQSSVGKSALASNYNGSAITENLSLTQFSQFNQTGFQQFNDTKSASEMMTGLLAAPYHMTGLLSPNYEEVGVAYRRSRFSNGKFINVLEIVSGSQDFNNKQQSKPVLHYPCANTTTAYQLTHESPNPIPNRDLSKNPIGQPIYLLSVEPIKSVVTASLTNGTQSIPLITLNKASDPNHKLSEREVILIPSVALKPNTTYNVSYTLRFTNGKANSNNFSFKTKS